MIRVFVSSVIDAPAEEVWAVVRGFGQMPDWHPLIARARIEGGQPEDRVGCVRDFVLTDGGRIRERLLSLSDYDLAFSYCILESPLGVEDYVAELRLIPVTDGGCCFAQWSAEFACPPEREAELSNTIGRGVFQAGFDALNERFGRE